MWSPSKKMYRFIVDQRDTNNIYCWFYKRSGLKRDLSAWRHPAEMCLKRWSGRSWYNNLSQMQRTSRGELEDSKHRDKKTETPVIPNWACIASLHWVITLQPINKYNSCVSTKKKQRTKSETGDRSENRKRRSKEIKRLQSLRPKAASVRHPAPPARAHMVTTPQSHGGTRTLREDDTHGTGSWILCLSLSSEQF